MTCSGELREGLSKVLRPEGREGASHERIRGRVLEPARTAHAKILR